MEPTGECYECGGTLHLLQAECTACDTPYEWSFVSACPACDRERDLLQACECGDSPVPWRALEILAREQGSVTIDKDAVERPSTAGYARHLGTIRGQWGDYRRPTENGEFHVRVYLDHYELHVDDVSALGEPAKHTFRYGPKAAVTTTGDVIRGVRGAAGRVRRLARSAVTYPRKLGSDSNR